MVRYAMVVDLNRCVGCRTCMVACKVENNTPSGIFWMHVFRVEDGTYPNVRMRYLPRPCMHCDNAPCVKVCPVGARFKRDDGIVATDFDRCIGCRYCQVACPYGVNYFNWKPPDTQQYFDWNEEGKNVYGSGSVKTYTGDSIPPYKNPDHDKLYGSRRVSGGGHYTGVIEKCTFCIHRVTKGQTPACVDSCPVVALHFGDLDDSNSEVSQLLGQKSSFRLLENLNTQPKVFYIGRPPLGETVRNVDRFVQRAEVGVPRASPIERGEVS